MALTIISPGSARTEKQFLRASTKATTRKIGYATKLAMNAAKKDIKQKTKKRYTGSLRESYDVQRVGEAEYALRVVGSENLIKWIVHEEGRGPVNGTKERRLYIPLRKKGYDAYVRGSFEGLKWGKDYVFAMKAKSVKGHRLLYNATNVAKARFKARFELLFGTKRFLRG